MYKSISITSTRNIGTQVLKDTLTPTEKKILLHMLNAGLNEGQVRNKLFRIEKLGNNTAIITIGTITHSFILGRKETVKHTVSIKYN